MARTRLGGIQVQDSDFYLQSEGDTLSGTLSARIDAKPDTLLELTDTPSSYDNDKYLKSTISGTVWATVSGSGIGDVTAVSNLVAEGLVLGDDGSKGVKSLALGAANLKLFMNAAGSAPEWADGVKLGIFTRDTSLATGTQAITGVGFKPRVVFFFANISVTSQLSIGFDDGSNHYCLQNYHADTANSWTPVGNESIRLSAGAAGYYQGWINSIGSDGFTISWTKDGAKVGTATIYYLAFR